MEDIPRVAKRVRQACEPCRRKKSRCSGEQPICRTCSRLGQGCMYAAEPIGDPERHDPRPAPLRPTPDSVRQDSQSDSAERDWQQRVNAMETTLNEVMQILRGRDNKTDISPVPGTSQVRRAEPDNVGSSDARTSLHTPPAVSSSPRDVLVMVAKIYIRYCDSQPLPLFESATFVDTFPDRDPELICAVVALASRFCTETQMRSLEHHGYASSYHTAYLSVLDLMASDGIELSTLQTMCIIVLLDWDSGKYDRSRMLCAMAAALARSAQLNRSLSPHHGIGTACEERTRCYWAVDFLQRLFGTTESPDTLAVTLRYPISPSMPPEAVLRDSYKPLDDDRHRSSFGITTVLLRLGRPWSMAMRYVKTRGSSPSGHFPWHPDSQYSRTTACLMDLGLQLPLSHRYRSISIPRLNHQILEEHRGYWAPWFTTRLLYHTTLCLLNHPLLITLQIRKVQNVSEAFLQQTASTLTNHVSWCMHFIELMTSRAFMCLDPLICYCVAVVATIELQRSFLKLREGGGKSRHNFEECMKFIVSMENSWAFAGRTATRLRSLAADMASWSQSDQKEAHDTVSIDVNRVLDVLEFAPEAAESTSMFGLTLRTNTEPRKGELDRVSRLQRIAPVDREPINPRSPASDHSPTSGDPGDPTVMDIQGDRGADGVRYTGEEIMMSTFEFFNGSFQDFGLSSSASQGASINI